jgi:RHS repeat-associated protein
VAKKVGNMTTTYLVEDDVNPTGLPQVFEESVNGVVQRTYTYGLQRISENQQINGTWTPSFYGYDGMGSVRQLTGLDEKVTDTYNYDAFGNLLSSPGPTPNNYLYRGEQYDSELALYYLRARYYNPQSGRFLSRDPQDGNPRDPVTLHKYLYAGGDPINWFDPTGREADEEYGLTSGISTLNNVLVEGGSKVSQTEKAVNALAQLGCDIATSYSLSADTLNAVLWVFGYGDLAKKAIPPPPSPVQALCGWATLAGGGGL